jgi:polysaccharide pyruvyl transferase WcaK-like protein
VKTPPKRIGLFGIFGCGNSGNDGSLEAMLTFLQGLRPDANLTCICPVPDKVREDYRVLALPDRPSSTDFNGFVRLLNRRLHLLGWIYTIRQVRKLDLLIIPGTGILDDYRTGPWGIPYVLFRWCLSAKLSGTEVWFVSIGAGPIHHPLSRWLMKCAATVAQYRSYRDGVSKEFMMSVGFDTRTDPVYPDLAFRLPAPKFLTPRRADGEALTVALGVMSYGGWRHDHDRGADIFAGYLQKVTRFLTWLLDRGHNVRILTGETSDQHAVEELMRAVAAEGRIVPPERLVAEPILSLHDVMRQIALTDIVVATRFHNVVCALKLGRPTISIGYADKNDALLADMGLGDFCQHIESLDVDLLIKQFITLADKREEHEKRIREVNRAYQQRLAHQDALLASKLSPRSEVVHDDLSDPRAALSPQNRR